MLSPSSDSSSPPKVRQRTDSVCSDNIAESLPHKAFENADTSRHKYRLTQPDAPDYFNETMSELQKMLEPLSQLGPLVVNVETLTKSLQYVTEIAIESQQKCANQETKYQTLQLEMTEMERKYANLESKYEMLNEKIIDQDNYSRRDNLVFEGIAEYPGENLQHKMTAVFEDMGVDSPRNIQVVRCHRLMGSRITPKPIIIRFQYFQDRQRVWDKRFNLKGKNIFLKENFAPESEAKRKVMMPFFKAAKHVPEIKKRVLLPNGKLVLNNQVFTTESLDKLPDPLKPESISVKQNDSTVVFWSRHSIFSNFYPARFTTEGKNFNCSEQYMWFKCAELFQDKDSARAIMSESDPAKQKAVSRGIKNFDAKV